MKLLGNRRRQITLTISGGATEYNVRTAASSPADAVDVVVIVNSGALVNPSGPAAWALRFGTGWAAGCTFRLNNGGTITGAGGAGGNGRTSGAGDAGSPGGPAINLDGNPVSIDNTSGYIQGGGGGGGGTGISPNAGGGGGGAGWDGVGGGGGGSPGGGGSAGNAGTISAGGFGGDSGGGFYRAGTGGAPGSAGSAGDGLPGAGGAAGKAVDLSGGSVTWLGGFNGTQVKGAVS